MNTSARTTVHAREVGIARFLMDVAAGSATIREIWEALTRDEDEGGIADHASLPTYHRTVAKMVRRGHLEEVPSTEGPARFRCSAQLSPLNTFTLSDLETALWELSAPEALAQYLDAIDYFEARAADVLTRCAELLAKEEPVELILDMLRDEAASLAEDVQDLRDEDTASPELRKRVEQTRKNLARFVYGELGLCPSVWKLPSFEELLAGEQIEPADWGQVAEELSGHVFGDRFLECVHARGGGDPGPPMIVAGTDGSSHAGFVRGIPAPAYAEEEGRLVLTFNNSIAYVELPDDHPSRIDFPYHGVPMTRSALEDPHNRGMIVSRPWFPDLTDSEFEHMKKASLDVVQFRVDERIIRGAARAYGTPATGSQTGLLPKPNVVLRDGTVTPQEREFQHYTDETSYGDVVREGIALSWSILQEVAGSTRRVYGGCVKQTQLRVFSRIINWYIKRGSGLRTGSAVDPNWDVARAAHVSDSVAVTRLLNALPELPDGSYYRTCIVVRPFTAMVTSLRHLPKRDAGEWLEWFVDRQRAGLESWKKHGGQRPWIAGVDLEDDPYVRMCQRADYGMFYFGRPGGDPHLTFPRFEFMDALRERESTVRPERVMRATSMLIEAVDRTKWHLDKDHNFMSSQRLPRLVPYVVYEAHEKCKVLGHKLEAELRQAIAMRLSEIKQLRGLPVPKVDIEPVPVEKYLRASTRRLLKSGEDDE